MTEIRKHRHRTLSTESPNNKSPEYLKICRREQCKTLSGTSEHAYRSSTSQFGRYQFQNLTKNFLIRNTSVFFHKKNYLYLEPFFGIYLENLGSRSSRWRSQKFFKRGGAKYYSELSIQYYLHLNLL